MLFWKNLKEKQLKKRSNLNKTFMYIVVDTSALVRFFTDDIPQKASLVEKLLKEEKDIFIPDVVFPELEYILIKRYKFPRQKLLDIYSFLASQENVHTTKEARRSIILFSKTKLDMADCIIAAYSLKGSLASFDKELLDIDGVNAFWKQYWRDSPSLGTKFMKKRVFIVHGWDGHPKENWFPWLKKKLENKGFDVYVPQLPNPENPRIYNWIPALAKTVGTPDKQTYFVGHSLGCQAIARYLGSLPKNIKVGGAVFVAGFFKSLTGLEDEPGVPETDRHWLGSPVDFKKVKSHMPKSVAIFSDNDPYVPFDNQDDFRNKLGSKIIIEHQMGHFNTSAGITELPIALKSVLEISQ